MGECVRNTSGPPRCKRTTLSLRQPHPHPSTTTSPLMRVTTARTEHAWEMIETTASVADEDLRESRTGSDACHHRCTLQRRRGRRRWPRWRAHGTHGGTPRQLHYRTRWTCAATLSHRSCTCACTREMIQDTRGLDFGSLVRVSGCTRVHFKEKAQARKIARTGNSRKEVEEQSVDVCDCIGVD
jgi:hypothetical protein